MIAWFEIGFLPIRIWDILDIVIVGYLIYQIYKLLRGSVAFNIFVGVILIYVLSWLVKMLQMDLLSSLLGQFVSVGVLMLLIVFQPEVRRFLLILGNNTLRQRSNFFNRLLSGRFNLFETEFPVHDTDAILNAMLRMSRTKTGALIVFTNNLNLEYFSNSGVQIDAKISQPLIESIFNKESPLHDGAVIISNNKIHAASCVLPLSSNPDLPKSAGLRHRAAVGVTESSNVTAFIVSEESGAISYAENGNLARKISEKRLKELLLKQVSPNID